MSTLPLLVLLAAVPLAACKDKPATDTATPTATPPPSAKSDNPVAASSTTPPPAEPAAATATPLAPGAPAPDFTAEAHDGRTIHLQDLRGKPVVLYFYPKDETPGCTAEAQDFRDELPDLAATGATVIGVSMDSLDSHREFAKNHQLTFPLLSDPDGAIAARYGVSTASGHARRVTFVIDGKGTIAKVFPQVSVQGHADEVAQVVRSL
jgi:peroxiredoxin Q/BCP